MIGGLIIFILIVAVLILCFSLRLVGGLLKFLFFLLLGLPLAIVFTVFGALLCCTIICIPLGLACFKLVGWVFSPLRARPC